MSIALDIRFKAREGDGGNARAEHADVVRARERVKEEFGLNVSLAKMRALLEAHAARNENGFFTIQF
ncbi:MAG: hypothetical protein C4520_10540 [Candidatus Abyssobacteria bacterium SURF_5]|uniref:Uncharacterized protein n=1 Tax=Abyssobacteria bacterium (strain SURF_5) TaxID=2093360 RepID=A0A3A4NRM2_ABYX5|nr:MAG: hypothetical protein C4520_10540 [Candidatus Abyssubacteria bacterium SURF_5]